MAERVIGMEDSMGRLRDINRVLRDRDDLVWYGTGRGGMMHHVDCGVESYRELAGHFESSAGSRRDPSKDALL